MTVYTTDSLQRFITNGATTNFPFGFRFLSDEDITVSYIGADGPRQLVLGSDYILSGEEDEAGGTVVTTRAFPSGTLVVSREMSVTQETSLRNQGAFFSQTLENAFDRLTMLIQQAFSGTMRALRVQDYDPIPNRIPGVAQRAGKLLSFDSAGNPIAAAAVGGSATELAMRLADPFDPNNGAALVGRALRKGEVIDPTDTSPGTSVTRGFVHAYYPAKGGALRVGGSDLVPLDDERGYWSGLPSQNAWGDPANIGLYSQSFGRNGAAYGTYSTAFGHDCVPYGTASMAGGAGSATGNPSNINDPFNGYCSFAFGKNVLASGQKCVAIGEEHIINTQAGVGLGYKVTSQPSAAVPQPVGASGQGSYITLTGQSHGLGDYLGISDGVTVGKGFNPGSPLNSLASNELTLGMGTQAFRVGTASGNGTRGRIGVNNFRGINNEFDMDLTPGQRAGITIDGTGFGTFALMGVKSDGGELPLVSFVWSHSNTGTALGTLDIRMNGRSTSALTINADGSIGMPEMLSAAAAAGKPSGTLFYDTSGNVKRVP